MNDDLAPDVVAKWLESPDGEYWSRWFHSHLNPLVVVKGNSEHQWSDVLWYA